ncbi:MAG: heparinase II/III family protein, partial [Armatimonadota bacterium]
MLQRFAIVISIAVLAVSTAGAADTEVPPLMEQGFEKFDPETQIPDGWSYFGSLKTATVTEEHAYSGSYSLKVVDDDDKNAIGLRSPKIPVEAGDVCWVEWWYYGEKSNNQAMYIEFWTDEGGRPEPPARSYSCRGEGEWKKHIARYRAPEGTVAVSVHCNSYSTNTATGYFDDISFGTGAKAIYDRTLQPPVDVEHPCGMYRADDVKRAKRNIEKHEWARGVFNGIQHRADFWMDVPDEKLDYWIPDLTPFRVVDCPNCGAGWRRAWSNPDPDHIKCRSCGFTWPHPDYKETEADTYMDPVGDEQTISYYKGEPSTEHGAAQTERYRLSGRVRYHRAMKLGSAGSLGLMYALTGEKKYAEKFRKVMLRLAEVYPHYLAHDWNRVYEDYSNLQSGKLNGWKLTDAGIFRELATAWDLTYNSGVYNNDDISIIEERCFREFNRLMTATSPRGCCINDGPIAMAAGALTGLIVGDHDTIAWAIEPPDGFIGFLEDYFVRDGHWYEASPSYEGMAMGRLHITPEVLQGYSDPPSYDDEDRYDNLNLFTHPLMEKIMLAGAYSEMPDGNMPPTNDSTFGASYPATRAEINYNWYPTQRNKRIMAWAYGGKVTGGSEYALFRRDPDISFDGVEPLSLAKDSCIQPGVGWGILRTGETPTDAALFIDYGPHGSGHGHPDRLNVIYYDYGAEMVTDMGYLGWGHPIHPWMRTTLSHNEVIVNGEPQGRPPGELEAYSGDGNIRGIIASAPDVYETADVYRRNLIFVNHGIGRRYVVDCFHVRGGEDHQYAFHGNSESFVPPALDYDSFDATTLGEKATGYDWLEDAKRAETDDALSCQWSTDQHPELSARLHMMGAEDTEFIYGVAPGLRDRHNPFGERDLYKTLVRRPGPENHFLSVFEVATDDGGVESVRELQTNAEGARAVEVTCGDVTDIAIVADEAAADETVTIEEYPALRFTGRLGFVSLRDGDPVQLWMLAAEHLAYGGASITGEAEYAGAITAINQEDYTLTVDADIPAGKRWAGQQLIVRDRVTGAYEMQEISKRDGKTVVTMANEPIFELEVGDDFVIRPAASVARLEEGLWQFTGQAAQVQFVTEKLLADGRVITPANGTNHPDAVYVKAAGERWRQYPCSRTTSE